MQRFYTFLYRILIFGFYINFSHSSSKKLTFSANDVGKWASKLGEDLYNLAQKTLQVDDLVKRYKDAGAKVEKYEPEDVLDFMIERVTNFLDKRRTLAQILKSSLEVGNSVYHSPDETLLTKLNCYDGPAIKRLSCMEEQTQRDYRFVDARSDEWYSSRDGESSSLSDNDTDYEVRGIWNPNFYNLSVDISRSAVHVPTPIYKYSPVLLEEIYWSGYILNPIFKERREKDFPGASWQFYCSKSGFMRFYPGALWNMEMVSGRSVVDLYDCRNTEWYIDAATNTKNIIILLDMSGSMYGQRYEIAKQTIEMIFETLSENDFFNIITFSQHPQFIIPCFRNTLVQATLRNKRLMRDQFSNTSKEPENVADLGKALKLAFETLIGLNVTSNWTLPKSDHVSDSTDEEATDFGEYTEFVEDMIENRTEQLGCNSAIMLITDGATDFHTNIFETFNKDKKIRFFSFLIGNDVTQRQEVEWMACTNRGYFVHISNLADVQEKVQKYLQVMSQPIARRNSTSKAVWTGAYLDKMGQRLVTTVAYPVVVNNTFKGVVGASAPITELQQMAAVYMLGANAYSFLVDNNGYAMFHPQLRPWYKQKAKPNYNSMDIMELEVLQANTIVDVNDSSILHPKPADYNHQLRKYLVNATSSKTVRPHVQLDVLFAMEGADGLRRIYEQTNVYYFRGINDTLMTLGLAVPPDSTYRVEPPFKYFPLDEIELQWFSGSNWRLHPDWQYCRPNDTDYPLTKEDVFFHYLKFMKKFNQIPEKCANYSYLINRLLFDAKITCPTESCWMSESEWDLRSGIHMVFFATHTGLTRSIETKLADISYDPLPSKIITDANGTETFIYNSDEVPYTPFIKRHVRGLDENFYRRSMRYHDGELLFDVNTTNIVYLKNSSTNFHSYPESKSMIITATRSVFLNEGEFSGTIGVVGFEMLYASLANMVQDATNKLCKPGSEFRCYLLDEHGYIVYTSAANDIASLSKYYLGKFFGHSPYVPDWQRSFDQLGIPNDKTEALAFTKLIEKEFYENFTYIDFQAMCSNAELGSETKASAARLLSPLFHIINLLKWIFRETSLFLAEFLLLAFSSSAVQPTNAYTSMFRDLHEGGGPCDKWSPFYLLKKTKTKPEILFNGDVDCIDEKNDQRGICSVQSYAARVPKTNMVLVLLRASSDCSKQACIHTQRTRMPLFGLSLVHNASDKLLSPAKCEKMQYEARYRRSPNVCFQMDDDDDTKGQCSGVENRTIFKSLLIFTLIVFLFSFYF